MNNNTEKHNDFLDRFNDLKVKTLEQFSKILLYQIANNNLSKNIIKLEDKISTYIENSLINDGNKNIFYYHNVNNALNALHELQDQNNCKNLLHFKNNLTNLNDVFNKLLFEHSLVEKQIKFLKGLTIAYSKSLSFNQITNMLLHYFYCYFPFYFVAICHKKNKATIQLQLYYTSDLPETQKQNIIKTVKARFYQQHNIDVVDDNITQETLRKDKNKVQFCLEDVNIISNLISQNEDSSFSKILAIACAVSKNLTNYEIDITKTNLSALGISLNTNLNILSETFSKIKYYASHDVLTGLCNRHYFDTAIGNEIERAQKTNNTFSILMIDLDNFKTINDSYGHLAGDVVLKKIATMISQSVRNNDIVARIGGDEFAVILIETETKQAITIAERLRKNVQDLKITIPSGETFHTSVSIGVSNYPNNTKNAEELISSVDIALYQAKNYGKNTAVLSDNPKKFIESAHKYVNSIEKIKTAMAEDRIIPYFQPIVNCKTNDIYAYEVLARIREPNNEITTAGEFITLIEKSSLYYEFNEIIINKALKAFKQQLSLFNSNQNQVRLFINLPTIEIQNKKILDYTNNLCEELKIPTNCITFEFLERDAIQDLYSIKHQMANAREKGFCFAIDDFGSCYNSLTYLRDMKFEYLKIDGLFVKNILNSQIDYVLIKHIQNLCNELGIIVIAEFVESKEILNKLQEINVTYGQGYYLGKPNSNFQNTFMK